MHSRESQGSSLPSTSIVIPALNCVDEVEACIEALQKQDYPSELLQIVVADNGSTDGTREKLAQLGVETVVRNERGRSRAQNAGLQIASGDIILTTDMSCIAQPDWVRNVVACFSDPTVGCVAGDIEMVPDGSNMALRFQMRNRYMSPLSAFNRRELPFLPYADGANASFRREVFDQIGGFEESFFKAADVEICYRLLILTEYKIVFCKDCLMKETGEPDLRALLYQRYRMGMGSHLLRARFPQLYRQNDESKKGLRHFYWSFQEKLTNIARTLGYLLRGNRAQLEDAIVGRLMWRSQQRGYRRGTAFLQEQPVQPEPVDAGKIQAFIQRLPEALQERVLMSTSNKSGTP